MQIRKEGNTTNGGNYAGTGPVVSMSGKFGALEWEVHRGSKKKNFLIKECFWESLRFSDGKNIPIYRCDK